MYLYVVIDIVRELASVMLIVTRGGSLRLCLPVMWSEGGGDNMDMNQQT